MYCRASYTHAQAFTAQHRSPALSVLVSGWITTNALFLSQASQAIVQSRRVQNRQINRRRQISTGMSASRQEIKALTSDVVYFAADSLARIFRRAALLVRVGVKKTADPIPVCYCFGFTRGDIHDEIAKTGRSTIAEQITTEIKSGNCASEVKNPSGKCCLGSVTGETSCGVHVSDAHRHRSQPVRKPSFTANRLAVVQQNLERTTHRNPTT